MKISVVLLLVFLSVLMTASAAARSSGQCQDNPFVESLVRRGVTLYKKPLAGVPKCDQEWQTYGTCCEVGSLAKLAARQSNSIANATAVVRDFIKYYYQFFDEAFDRAAELANSTSKIDPTKKKVVKFLVERSSSNFRKHVDFVVDQNSTLKDFPKCWQFIAKKRSNSLCSICSGGSARFFLRKKVIIHPHLCRATMSKCNTSLLVLVRLFRSLGYFAEAMADIYKDRPYLIKQINNLQIVSKKLRNNHMLSSLWAYFSQNKTKQERARVSANICRNFLSIVGPTFVERLGNILTFDNSFFGYLKDYLHQYVKDVDEPEEKNTKTGDKSAEQEEEEDQTAAHRMLFGTARPVETPRSARRLQEFNLQSNFRTDPLSSDESARLAQLAAENLLKTDVFIPRLSYSSADAVGHFSMTGELEGKNTLNSMTFFP